MKTLSILLLSVVYASAQICHTNYSATFTWGTNSMSGDQMGLYANGLWVSNISYPSTNLLFNITQVPNMATLTIQGQRGSSVVNGDMSYTFNTNNFPLGWGQPHLGPIVGL